LDSQKAKGVRQGHEVKEQIMRINIVHPGAGELKYEIRGIVKFALELERTGIPIIWENIGDPVAKGEGPPQWICDIVADEARQQPSSFGYSPTKGVNEARDFLASLRSRETGAHLGPEEILFFNGLGDAITKVYTWLNPSARVLGPNPAYPTHSSVEGAHGRSRQPTYDLDPANGWLPNVEDVRNKVKYNPQIAGLLIINPDNPTGMVYPRHVLEEFVSIAKEYNLFLIADEIYANLAFDTENFTSLAKIMDDVPTIIMRGLSKEVPWPGSRCGWLEFYNAKADPQFREYVNSIEEAKMTEVCSTTLPQAVLPKILSDARYPEHLAARRQAYQERAAVADRIINASPHLRTVPPKGAFYLPITFTEDFMAQPFTLPAANPAAQQLLDVELAKISEQDFDKRFCHQLLAATGLCTVPLTTGFNSSTPGLRMTLLESNPHQFQANLQTLVSATQASQ
jgi:aspartate/methionine/tyrosine aminotransferase